MVSSSLSSSWASARSWPRGPRGCLWPNASSTTNAPAAADDSKPRSPSRASRCQVSFLSSFSRSFRYLVRNSQFCGVTRLAVPATRAKAEAPLKKNGGQIVLGRWMTFAEPLQLPRLLAAGQIRHVRRHQVVASPKQIGGLRQSAGG